MSDFTPPPITGYRVLSQAEVDLMNEIKAHAAKTGELCERLEAQAARGIAEFLELGEPDVDSRWVAIGTEKLQLGFMALVRAVARPESF